MSISWQLLERQNRNVSKVNSMLCHQNCGMYDLTLYVLFFICYFFIHIERIIYLCHFKHIWCLMDLNTWMSSKIWQNFWQKFGNLVHIAVCFGANSPAVQVTSWFLTHNNGDLKSHEVQSRHQWHFQMKSTNVCAVD